MCFAFNSGTTFAVTCDDGKKPLKFINFMILQKEGQIL